MRRHRHPVRGGLHGRGVVRLATDSSGVVRILKDLDAAIEGRDVLIVEDIVDSGLTLQYLLRNLGARDPARSRSARCSPSPSGGRSICPRATSASRSPTALRSATASTTRERYRNLPYVAALQGR